MLIKIVKIGLFFIIFNLKTIVNRFENFMNNFQNKSFSNIFKTFFRYPAVLEYSKTPTKTVSQNLKSDYQNDRIKKRCPLVHH